ncbi:MAG: hypothetical protein ABSA34_03720 [Candidatus Goldiibacteriota bacterium]|jgi:hypothetical protein
MFDFKKYLDIALKEDALVLFKRVYDRFLKPVIFERQLMEFSMNEYNFSLTTRKLNIKNAPSNGQQKYYLFSDRYINGILVSQPRPMSQRGKRDFEISKIETMKFEGGQLKIYPAGPGNTFVISLNIVNPEETAKIDELIGKYKIQLNILRQENNQAGK